MESRRAQASLLCYHPLASWKAHEDKVLEVFSALFTKSNSEPKWCYILQFSYWSEKEQLPNKINFQAKSLLAWILWLARMANPRTGMVWTNLLSNVNFDQNISACLFLDVHLKIVDGNLHCLQWILHKTLSSLHWKSRDEIPMNDRFAHIFPILHHISKQSISSTPLILNTQTVLSWQIATVPTSGRYHSSKWKGTTSKQDKCSALVFACLKSVACYDNQPKDWQVFSNFG